MSFTSGNAVDSACSSPLTISSSYIKTLPNSPLLWEPCLGLFARISSTPLSAPSWSLSPSRADNADNPSFWPSSSGGKFPLGGGRLFWKVLGSPPPLARPAAGFPRSLSLCLPGRRPRWSRYPVSSPRPGHAAQCSGLRGLGVDGTSKRAAEFPVPGPPRGSSTTYAPPPRRWPSLIGCGAAVRVGSEPIRAALPVPGPEPLEPGP